MLVRRALARRLQAQPEAALITLVAVSPLTRAMQTAKRSAMSTHLRRRAKAREGERRRGKVREGERRQRGAR